MKIGKNIKILLKSIGVIISLILIGIILLFIFFPTEKVKEIAIKEMQKQFHREVKIGDLGLNLFKGIVIKDVEISNYPTFKKGEFIVCKAFVFSYDLWELIHKRLVIKKLTLESPHIYITRYMEKGKARFNFSDLIPPIPEKKGKKVEKKEIGEKKNNKNNKAKGNKKAGIPKVSKYSIPVDLQIGKVGLEDAKIELTDTATPHFKDKYSIYNIHFLVENIKVYENAPLKISTGFGLSMEQLKDNKKTDKHINLEADIDGKLFLFNKKGILDPSGYFNLALKNGKFYGIQAYEALKLQANDISKDINNYQNNLLKSYKKMVEKIKANEDKLKKAGKLASTVKKGEKSLGKVANKLANLDVSFIRGALDWKFLKKNFEFDKVETKVKIKNSKVISDKVELKGEDFRAEGSGYTGFDTTVNYIFSLIAAKKYNKNMITESIANKNGEPVFPVKITGTISDMKIEFEKKKILSNIKQKLREELENKLKEKGIYNNEVKKYLNEYAVKYLGDKSKYLSEEARKKAVEDAKAKLEAEKKKREEEARKKAEAEKKRLEEEAKRKAEEAKKRAEAEKKKKEEEAKKKAAEAAKKQLKKFGF